MIGLFQEHGPCLISNSSDSVYLNRYSWNNNANMLYIDSPVGTGFSYGSLKDVGTSQAAARGVWNFLQIFLGDERFAKLRGREMGLWTES
jgi:carboxypeptidase C (cathepsin A)